MSYCRTTTENHSVAISHPSTLKDFNIINAKEGYSGPAVFTNGEIVIDMDEAEAIISRNEGRVRRRSMDISFAVDNLNLSGKEMVLVELRYNYVNMQNLSRTILEEKVIGSLNVIGTSVPIYTDYIFIFQSNLIQQARSRFFRMNPRINSNYVVMDINDLKVLFF